ncbi:hypothetical protein QBC34DRAFT_433119 [Podospora aff. communis PSN243]|uniref:Uncharacterized protein n=1 Tax=Podospora aff. communis PSN243 TaxID=3040156 RepID=A0AAV9H3A0_9PEZI|nr:hypothetical protein QBC34DRAFT_433119 [Podospora aff. communis PSN243]
MLPPVEDAVLQHNPNFAALYKTLTTSILNPDGSTKHDHAAKERNAVREELKKHRLEAAKKHLLVQAISSVDPTPQETKPAPSLSRRAKPQPPRTQISDLPSPLLDLLLLLPPFLSHPPPPLDPPSTALLLNSPPFSSFPSLLPSLSTLLSTTLHTSAVHLARVANPATNPSFVHRTIPSLPDHLATLTTSITTRQDSLTRSRLAAATSLSALLHYHAQALALLLRSLEAKHGPIARSLEFRATEVSLTAQRQETEAQIALWNVRKETYTPEVAVALGNYVAHLKDAKARLGEAVRTLRAELDGYGVGGEREGRMREMARVKREMGRQVEDVRGDLERLGRA